MNVPERTEWLHKVYSSRNVKELAERYDAWAEDYEQDVCSFGYKSPDVITDLIERYVEKQDGPILDAGAGTGILGEKLTLHGYDNLTGIDLSPAMLDVARKKGIYKSLQQMVLGEHLKFSDNYFSAVVSMGVFTENHAPPESFDELIRITKPGGHIVFSVRSDTGINKNYQEKQDSLLTEGKWDLVEASRSFQCLPEANPEVLNRVFVYRVY